LCFFIVRHCDILALAFRRVRHLMPNYIVIHQERSQVANFDAGATTQSGSMEGMSDPHVPPLRRQVITHHPVEKSLRAVIALQVIAGLGLVGTILLARTMQPEPATSQCHWSASPHGSESTISNLPQQVGPMVVAPSPAPCGTARVVKADNRRSLELRFDNCADGVQPEPTEPVAPPAAVNENERTDIPYERYRQQNNSLDFLQP
jgi:hypothetical protein